MKKINSFVAAHLSPDVLHFELSYNTTDTQVESELNSVKWLWQELCWSQQWQPAPSFPSFLYLDLDQCLDTEQENDLCTTEI